MAYNGRTERSSDGPAPRPKSSCVSGARNAMRRCFGVHAREFFTALHDAAGADIILERMKQGRGHELHAADERPDGHARDCCNLRVQASKARGPDEEVLYDIWQNQVGDHPVTLASGLTREAARNVVLSFEFDARLEHHEPRDWPAGVWRSFKDRDAWK